MSAVPLSPLRLAQEAQGAGCPWRIALCCCLIRRASGRYAAPVVAEVLRLWPDPTSMAAAGPALEALLAPLGLANVRARSLRAMSADAAAGLHWRRWRGVGPYAADSIRLFSLGLGLDGLEGEDGWLAAWAAWHNQGPGAEPAAPKGRER